MAIRITYNSVNIDLKVGPRGIEIDLVQVRNQDRSSTGKTQTINSYGIQEVALDTYFEDAVERTLWAWWSWARQGKPFSVAFDTGYLGNTTLDDAAAAGQKVIPITDTTLFDANHICLLKAVDADDEFELVTIASVNVGVSVSSVDNLVYSYESGDVFRHKKYWPSVYSMDSRFKPVRDGENWTWTFNFAENL